MDIAAWREAVALDYATLSRTPRERLKWITIILDAKVVRLGDDIAAETANTIAQFRDSLRTAMMRSGRIRRGTRWAGTIELDLIHPRMLKGLKLLADLGIDAGSIAADQRIAITHYHAVIDHSGHQSSDAMMRDLRQQWPGHRRVHSADIHDDGTISSNLSRLSEYSTKLKFGYSQAWEGRPTRYSVDYESEWKSWVMNFYTAIGWANLIVSNVKSQSVECTPQIRQTLTAQGFETRADELQLSDSRNDTNKAYETLTRLDNDENYYSDILSDHRLDILNIQRPAATRGAFADLEAPSNGRAALARLAIHLRQRRAAEPYPPFQSG